MTTKHTPGPWTRAKEPIGDMDMVGPNGECIIGGCGCCGSPFGVDGDPDSTDANAHLIAAAPDLLEALEAAYMILNSLDPEDSPGGRQRLADTLATIRAAIAKAKP
jgi:hypothetical protein